MRIVCISDTHEKHNRVKLPEGDVLIHAGDWTSKGNKHRLQAAGRWFAGQASYSCRIAIAGNHDISLQYDPGFGIRCFADSVYLAEGSVDVQGLKVFGTPWSTEFNGWAFGAKLGEECRKHWARIPRDTDILVVHGGPFGYGDRCLDGRRVGCPDLTRTIEEICPKLVVCGHIHEDYGVYTMACGTTVVNASLMDSFYSLVNSPIVIDL